MDMRIRPGIGTILCMGDTSVVIVRVFGSPFYPSVGERLQMQPEWKGTKMKVVRPSVWTGFA